MKSLFFILCLTITLPAFTQGKIEVVVTNIKVNKGNIRVGLFNSEKDFLQKAVAGKVVKVSGNKAVVSFEGLVSGEYAVSVIHDENSNEELDKNLVGIPTEGFAFGNNAMGTFGPPPFEKAKVKVDGNTIVQEISMRYF